MSSFNIMRTDMVVVEVSREGGDPGMVPMTRVVLGWPGRPIGTGAEFTLSMDDAPRVGDTYTVFAIPGQVDLDEYEPKV